MIETTLHTFKNSDFEMEYFSFGNGKNTMVILPGISFEPISLVRSAIAKQYSMFIDEFTIYVFDRKKKLEMGYSVEQMADDTATALIANGIENIYLFGTSQGGMIAQYIAVKYPQLVKKLLIASSASKQNQTLQDVIGRWIALAEKGNTSEAAKNVFQSIYSDDYYSANSKVFNTIETLTTKEGVNRLNILANACLEFDIYDRLNDIVCPVLVVGSHADRVLSGEASVEIADALGCELVMYEGYSHACYDEAPDFREILYNFFTK